MGKKGLIVLFAGLIFTATSIVSKGTPDSFDEIQGGYYLLHQLADEESSVSMLFIVKDAPDQIGLYGKQVGQVAQETVKAIDEMEAKSPSLRVDKDSLPQIELDVRASIREDKEHQLLFGSSGNEFIRVFLTTQIQASTYGLNLCKVLAEKETNAHRAQVLRALGAKWQKVRDDAFRLMRDY